MRVLMLYPEFPDTFWSFKHAVRFVSKRGTNPPLGLLTVAAMLPADWELRLIDLNVTTLRPSDLRWAEMVFISAMDVQRDSTHKLIKRVKAVNLPVVAGGPLFTGEYDSFPGVDHFVLNEAEITLPRFLSDLQAGHPHRLYQSTEFPDITQTPIPRWDLLDMKHYDSMAVQFSRGCPFDCEFCNITALFGHLPRVKTATQLIAELDSLYNAGWRRNIFLVDDNFIGNKRVLKTEVLPALIEWRKDKIGCLFLTEVSINLADDDDLVTQMVQAGFTSIFVGIETPDEDSLIECNKKQNIKRDLIASVKKLQRAGLQVMAGFIVGFDSDTEKIFDRQVDFIQNSGIVTAMVGLLQAPFGTRLYQRMAKENRLLTEMSGDNADGSTNIIPKMEANQLRTGYLSILKRIYSPEYFYERIKTFLLEFQPARASVHLELREILAFFRSIIRLGILGKERRQYWDLFFWSLRNRPDLFPMAITLSIYGYHFRRVSEQHFIAASRNSAVLAGA